MTSDANPLGIIEVPVDEEGTETRAYIPLDVISEDEIERLRAEHLEVNDGSQSGESAPGVKADADEQQKKLLQEALDNPIDGEAQSPSDALG